MIVGWEVVLHEQTGLSTSTVTDNDQLATDFRHLRDWVNEESRKR